MKTAKTMLLVAATIAVLSLTSNLDAQEPVFRAKAPTNDAVLASPRAIEVFPWLVRGQPPRVEPKAKPVEINAELMTVNKNRALASGPRLLEQFPELARAPRPDTEQLSNLSMRPPSIPARVLRNKARAASPRVLEEFPGLARRGPIVNRKAEFQIAPLK